MRLYVACLFVLLAKSTIGQDNFDIDDPESPIYVNKTGRTQDQILLAKWENLEKMLKSSVSEVIKMALPTLVRTISEAEVNSDCQSALFNLLGGLKQLNSWAVKMIDSCGKLTSGIMAGSTTDFGSYEQCLQIRVPNPRDPDNPKFTGRFCNLEVKPMLPKLDSNFGNFYYEHSSIIRNQSDKVVASFLNQINHLYFNNFRWGICVPSTCEAEDLEKIINKIGIQQFVTSAQVTHCEVIQDTIITEPQMIAMICIGVAIIFVLFATMVDNASPKPQLSVILRIFHGFSLKTTLPSALLPVRRSSNYPSHLDGFRAITLVWIMFGSIYLKIKPQIISKALSVEEFISKVQMQPILSYMLGYDTMVFCMAYLLGHTVGTRLIKTPFMFVYLLADRIVRHIFATLVAIACTLLLPLILSGPLWKELTGPLYDNCIRNWWTNVLFINNFVDKADQRCLENSWFISCTMQLFIIGLVLVALLSIKSIGSGIAFTLTIASSILIGLLTYSYSLPPATIAFLLNAKDTELFEDLMVHKPYSYIPALCFGLLLGHWTSSKKSKISNNSCLMAIGWLLSFAASSTAILGIFKWNSSNYQEPILSVVFAVGHRFLWAGFLSFVSFACHSHQSGTVNRLLSWSAFVPISRLFTFAFLIGPLYQTMTTAQISTPIYVSFLITVMMLCGNFLLSMATSLAGSLLTVGPWSYAKLSMFSKYT